MGAFDWLGQAGSWFKNRWNEDWNDFGKTFVDSWKAVPGNLWRAGTGMSSIALAATKDDGDVWGAARMWADSSIGLGSNLLGGTLGTIFQVPILHEAAWLLDKAYRYVIARPITTPFLMISQNELEAYRSGENPDDTFFDYMFDMNHLKRAWNESEFVTPGQAMVYGNSMSFQTWNDYDKGMQWAIANDPRTPEGQRKYNSAEADTWLKYASGSMDFALNAVADPLHGASSLTKLAKLRLVDKVADARYIEAGKVQAEVGGNTFNAVRELAKNVSMEELRDLTMPNNRHGGQMSAILWASARHSDETFADAWLATRAADPSAFQRLGEKMPAIGASMADMFANFAIKDWDRQRSELANGTGADALRQTKIDALIDSFTGREGLFGKAYGLGVNEPMPKARFGKDEVGRTVAKPTVVRGLRAGYHSFVLHSAPIIVGRPLANALPSQGHTPLMDANDATGITLKQFKANIERSTTRMNSVLSPKEINQYTSMFGSATSDATRHAIAMQAEDLILDRTLKEFGIALDDLPKVMFEVNKWRNGVRRIVAHSRFYISDQARKRAESAAADGNVESAANLLDFAEIMAQSGNSRYVTNQLVAPFVDDQGRANLVPLARPSVIDPTLPILRSQFAEAITMMDYRALRATLRWYNLTHPKPKFLPDPSDPSKFSAQPIPLWREGLAKAAKARGFYEASISALDALSSMWKATVLMRPAQAPRNIASDTLLTMVEFGRLPLVMAAAQGVVNTTRNFFGRGKLGYEVAQSALTARRASRTTNIDAVADVDVHVPGNVPTHDPTQAHTYMTFTAAFADGAISLQQYANDIDNMFSGAVERHHEQRLAAEAQAEAARLARAAAREAARNQGGFTPTAAREAIAQHADVSGDAGHLRAAAELVINENRVTRQSLIRGLGVDAATAARLINMLEDRGVIAEVGDDLAVVASRDQLDELLRLEGNRPERIDPNLIPGQPEGLSEFEAANWPPRRSEEAEAIAEDPTAAIEGPSGPAPEGPPVPGPDDWGTMRPNRSERGWEEHRDIEMPEQVYPPGAEPGGYPLGGGAARNRRGRPEDMYPAHSALLPNSVRQPYFAEYVHWRRWKQGEFGEGRRGYDRFKRAISVDALAGAGRAVYRQRKWGLGILRDVINRHLNRRNDPGYADNPYAPGTVVVDPFTGTQPHTLLSDIRKNWEISSEKVFPTLNTVAATRPSVRGTRESVKYGHIPPLMVEWINANADKLLRPDTMMAMRVKPDGHVAIGFATARKEVIDAGETIKPGALARLKNYKFQGIRDMGHTGFTVKDKNGRVIMSFAGWAEGATGQQFQSRLSAVDNPSTQFGYLTDVEIEDKLGEAGSMIPMDGHHRDYPANWERDVNAQIASDPIASKFLERKGNGDFKDVDDVLAEIEDTPWGTKWIHAMSFRGIAYYDQLKQVHAKVNEYVPHPQDVGDSLAKKAIALRASILEKKATYKQLEDLYRDESGVVDKGAMPEIHGQSLMDVMGNSRSWKFMRHTVRGLQKIISDMPVDKLARFPFMALSYQRHGTILAKAANSYFRDGPLPADVLHTIKETAREKAYHDTRYRLYDTAQRNDLASATRLLMPFSSAMMDSYIKYGRVIRENPMLLVRGAYYWDMFERNEMVQDENGNVARIEEGSLRWYSVDPKTGEKTLVPKEKVGKHKYVQFQLPSGLAHVVGQQYYGVDAKPVLAVNKDTLNVFLNTPSGGPLVALPANEFALHNPEFGEDERVKKYILPFGPSSSRTRAFMPSTVRTAWDAFVADDGDMAQGHAAAIMQAELIGYGLGTRNTPPTFEEVREKAAGLSMVRFMSTMMSPASFQVASPYQPYVDAYRQLMANPETREKAPEEFLRRYGDEFYAVQMSVTRNNAGLSASLESAQAYDKYRKLIEQYPEYGGLIVGKDNAGTFAKSVYEAQKLTPLAPGDTRTVRELLPLQDSTEDLQRKTVWAKYSQMMDLMTSTMEDRGIRSFRSRAAADLVDARNAFVEKNKYWNDPATGKPGLSPWYRDYMQNDRAATEAKINSLWAIVQDPQLQNRDDIRGLAQYLSMREEMQKKMKRWGINDLNNKAGWGLQNDWDQRVHGLVESNTAFGALWNRWLSNDDRLEMPADWIAPHTYGLPEGVDDAGKRGL